MYNTTIADPCQEGSFRQEIPKKLYIPPDTDT